MGRLHHLQAHPARPFSDWLAELERILSHRYDAPCYVMDDDYSLGLYRCGFSPRQAADAMQEDEL